MVLLDSGRWHLWLLRAKWFKRKSKAQQLVSAKLRRILKTNLQWIRNKNTQWHFNLPSLQALHMQFRDSKEGAKVKINRGTMGTTMVFLDLWKHSHACQHYVCSVNIYWTKENKYSYRKMSIAKMYLKDKPFRQHAKNFIYLWFFTLYPKSTLHFY